MKLKELFKIAKEELIYLNDNIQDIRLEQAEFNEKENLWEVVISYLVDNKNKIDKDLGINPLLGISAMLPFERVYKLIKIDENENIKAFYIFQKS